MGQGQIKTRRVGRASKARRTSYSSSSSSPNSSNISNTINAIVETFNSCERVLKRVLTSAVPRLACHVRRRPLWRFR